MQPINPGAFFDHIRVELFHGNMRNSQITGTKAILDAWPEGTDTRWVAYALATAHWETAQTMQPIEEYGKGCGRAYGAPAGPWHQVYDGRGDVQLTWLDNYAQANTVLHERGVLKPGENMMVTPELAMRPDVAAAVMVWGMSEGWFTGRKLADYFSGPHTDWINAREVINGHDHAAEIGGNALKFWRALLVPATV